MTKHTPGPWTTIERIEGGFDIHKDREDWEPEDRVGVHLGWMRAVHDAGLVERAPETAAERDRLREINAELLAALKEATATARACQTFHDEQASRRFSGDRPNWRKASSACFDEIDGKPDQWETAIARAEGEDR